VVKSQGFETYILSNKFIELIARAFSIELFD